ncbi:L,D-transpeptidase family protein [Paracoccus aminophilus]|uniref:Murein L,D-transpeptidase n=1 Tax=Paracoccus aminophilus JCM 7686 TaxID=1367847 RepID=S5YB04_PARAH|nr:L,D-transpeptidase family protein [Paracoccus aminophilus]AGT08593.1 murein L,D-transpeptidase [Paracoccus aminophilus JCM 7686]
MAGRVILASIALAAFWLPMASGAQGIEAAPVAAAPAPRLVFSDSEMALAQAVARQPGLAAFYGTNGLTPIFTGTESAARRAALIEAVSRAAENGLPASRYEVERLRALDAEGGNSPEAELVFARVFARWTHDISGGVLEPTKVDPSIKRVVLRRSTDELLHDYAQSPDPTGLLTGIEPQDPHYLALKKALGGKNELVAPAKLKEVEPGLWKVGMTGEPVVALRARLAAMGFDAGKPVTASSVFDAPLAAEVAKFQDRVGLPSDGVAGPKTVARINRKAGGGDHGILVALERMRWMNGHDLNARMVWVNLPEFNARVMENGAEVFETRTVIGRASEDRMTPEFSDRLSYLVVNPRWNVPRSITVKEYLPRLQANRNAVSQIDIVDGNGNIISRDRIDFSKYTAANFPYRMRQKESDDNALGQVKFIFPNPWNIYLHDTPTKHLFGQSARAYSHGCIRIGRPVDLAHELLSGQVKDPAATYQKALDTKKETWLALKPTIPVHLVYFTTFPDANGRIQRFTDVYGRDGAVYDALMRAGLETF